MEKIRLAEKFQKISEHWSPKVVGELNGQYVKPAKIKGEFDWHHHENEDELFLCVRGSLDILLRETTIHLDEGDIFIVPRGVEHKPVAREEAHILLLEPQTTLNTGNIQSDKTVTELEWI